jgi:hypothetical protein
MHYNYYHNGEQQEFQDFENCLNYPHETFLHSALYSNNALHAK